MSTALQDPDAQIEAEIAEALARGEDPYTGSSKGSDPAAKVESAPEVRAEPVAEAEPSAPATKAEQVDEATLQAITEDAPAFNADPLQFNVQVPNDYKAARAALLAEKSEAMGKLMEGELDAKEYAAIEARVMDGLEELSAQRIRAETLLEANAQTKEQTQMAVLQSLIANKRDEVDYDADEAARGQFNLFLNGVAIDPQNAGKPFAYLAHKAHEAVLAVRGLQPKSPADQAKPDRTAPTPPVTLGGLPTAATAGASTPAQVMANLSGEDFEKAYDALPEAERAKMLR